MTMGFDPDEPIVGELVCELAAAAGRGVHVMLSMDAVNFLHNDRTLKPGPLWYGVAPTVRSPRPFGRRFAALKTLQEAGGTYVITNRPPRRFTIPQAGRSHIKFAILNDRVYIGGCNLERPCQMDVMVSWQDQATADYLYGFAANVAQTASPRTTLQSRDTRHRVDTNTTLLFDAGVPRQSRILDEALRLIDSAQERIFMTCQFFPGGRTGQHLAAAIRRGVDVTLYYSPPSTHGVGAPGHYLYELSERQRNPVGLFRNRLPASNSKLHAKVLVTEKGAMHGSHNYVVQGVRLGTAEIALCSRDRDFAAALEKQITKTIRETLGE